MFSHHYIPLINMDGQHFFMYFLSRLFFSSVNYLFRFFRFFKIEVLMFCILIGLLVLILCLICDNFPSLFPFLKTDFIFLEQFYVHGKIEQKLEFPNTPCPYTGTASHTCHPVPQLHLLRQMHLH